MSYEQEVIEDIAAGRIDAEDAAVILAGARWFDRLEADEESQNYNTESEKGHEPE